jgi:hypothetical protein
LRADPGLRSELARKGRAFAEQHYDRDALAGRYLELLRDVTPSPSGRGKKPQRGKDPHRRRDGLPR